MRFVVFANPKARLFRDDGGAMDRLYGIASGRGLMLTPDGYEALQADLAELIDDEPQFLAVAGGDGTLSVFTTALLRVWPHDRLPPILPLHAGSMNTLSKSLGNRGEPHDQLDGVARGEVADMPTVRRWPLQVGEDRWGYLFGTGIIPRYIAAYDGAGGGGPREAARVLGSQVLKAFVGGKDVDAFFARSRADVFVDGKLLPLKEWLLIAAGATHDMGLGFRPFPGLLQSPGRFGVYSTASKPTTFATDLLPFFMGRPAQHSLAFHHVASELRLHAPEPIPYNLDGELEVGGTSITLRTGPEVRFVLPPQAKPVLVEAP